MRRAPKRVVFAAGFIALVLAFLVPHASRVHAQGTVQGQEKVVTYTGTNASLVPPNTPAGNFTAPLGLTTFIIPIANPTVSIRVYITNNTSTLCTGSLTLQMFAATDAQTNTFNGALANWQVVPVQDPTGSGQLIGITGLLTIPASGASYISSTAISAPKAAVQIVNVNGGCAGSTFEVTAVVSQVSVTSPLISSQSNSAFAGVGTNVQGVIPAGQNGAPVFPVIAGANLPATNAQTAFLGVDNFGSIRTAITGGTTATVTVGFPPAPSKTNDVGFASFRSIGAGSNGTMPVAPWACAEPSNGQTCGTGTSPSLASHFIRLANVSSLNPVQGVFNNSGAGDNVVNFVNFNGTNSPTVRQNGVAGAFSTAMPGNTLAGSTIIATQDCQTFPYTPGTIADSQGHVGVQILNTISTGNNPAALTTWIIGPTSAAADTVTVTGGVCGASNHLAIAEVSGITPANLNTPLAALSQSNSRFVSGEDDNGGLFVRSGGFSFSQTQTIASASTVTQSLWQQSAHGTFFSCTVSLRVTAASGTTPTLNTYLQDSADGIGWNDRASFPQATAAGNFLGSISGGSGGTTPAATTDGVLAAGSKVDGPVSDFGRLKFVVGGTGPSFTMTYNVACQ